VQNTCSECNTSCPIDGTFEQVIQASAAVLIAQNARCWKQTLITRVGDYATLVDIYLTVARSGYNVNLLQSTFDLLLWLQEGDPAALKYQSGRMDTSESVSPAVAFQPTTTSAHTRTQIGKQDIAVTPTPPLKDHRAGFLETDRLGSCVK